MKKKLFTRAAGALLAGAIVLTMSAASAFATTPAAYSPDANITVNKTLTTQQSGIWPDTTAFTFKLEAVGYTAGPASLSSPYTTYDATNLPMPAASAGVNTAAALADGAMAETITVNPFTKPSGATTETVGATTGNAAYTQAGVYTYKVTEIIPADAAKEPGVTYDGNVYFMNVYVTNVLNDDGTPLLGTNGLPAVNVSNITAFKATNGATDPMAADFGGVAANADASDAKTSITTPLAADGAVRNIAYSFANDYTTTDLVVTKKVTGTMADPNKEFGFALALTNSLGASDARSYNYQVYTMGADGIKGNTDDAAVAGKAGALSDGGTFTLKHNEYIVVTGLATGEKATVTENDATDYTTTIVNKNGTAADAAVTAKTVGEKTLSTDAGAVNQQDFVNNKEAVSPTGIALEGIPFVLVASAAGIALFFMIRKRRDGAR